MEGGVCVCFSVSLSLSLGIEVVRIKDGVCVCLSVSLANQGRVMCLFLSFSVCLCVSLCAIGASDVAREGWVVSLSLWRIKEGVCVCLVVSLSRYLYFCGQGWRA